MEAGINAVGRFVRGLFPERIYTTALIGVSAATAFALFVVNNDALRTYAMTVGGGTIMAFIAVAIVFAGRKSTATSMFRPIDVNFLWVLAHTIIVAQALLEAALRKGDFTTSALDALLGAVVVGIGSGIMAFAKKDAD